MDINFLTFILSVLVIGIMIYQVGEIKRQLRLNFFMEYTKRYQEIVLHLPLDIFTDSFDPEKFDDAEKEKMNRYFRMYVDLCSEEYFLKKSKNLDKKVWEEWEKGMTITFKTKGFTYFWQQYQNTVFYEDFKVFVDSKKG